MTTILLIVIYFLQVPVVNVAEFEDGGDCADGNKLYPEDGLQHHGWENVVGLVEGREEVLQEEEGVEVEVHADGAPLAPARAVVVPEQDDEIGDADAHAEYEVAGGPQAQVEAAGLHVTIINHYVG